MSTVNHGSEAGLDSHKWDETPLCDDCKAYKRQTHLLRAFQTFKNWDNIPGVPRLLSFHYRPKSHNRNRSIGLVPNKRPAEIKDPKSVSGQNIRDYYDYPRFSHEDVHRRVVKTPWGVGNHDAVGSDIMGKIYQDGLCLEESSSLPVTGGYQGTPVEFGMNSEEPDMLKSNRALCNACPQQGVCLETSMKLPDVTGMRGGRTRSERTYLRGLWALGLNSLLGKYRKTTRSVDSAKLVNGIPNSKAPEEIPYLD